MSIINFSDYYTSKYCSDIKKQCDICKRSYSKTYNLKNNNDDKDLLNESSNVFHICRKCMTCNSIPTKIKYRCSGCKSFFKSKCLKCENDKKLKHNIIEKIKSLFLKLNSKEDIEYIKSQIANL